MLCGLGGLALLAQNSYPIDRQPRLCSSHGAVLPRIETQFDCSEILDERKEQKENNDPLWPSCKSTRHTTPKEPG